MDPVLSSLFPINQIGSDGFNWWVGQIETNKNDDPKKSGRYRVRIVGQHLKDCDSTPTNELPWANVMMPVTAPFTDGLSSGASIGLEQGNWVVGFYMDSDKQKPIIMGSVGHTKASTVIKNTDPTPGKSCKSFTTYISSDANPKTDWPSANQTGTNEDGANVVSASEPAATYGYIPGQVPPVISSLLGKRSETNPTGAKHKYIIADPKCGSEGNLKSGITRILADLLKANQDAGGRLGDYVVSKANGQLYNYVSISRYHIGRVTRLVSSFIARVKGEIIKLLREGIQKLIDALILFDDPSGKIIGNTGPLKDPEKAFQPIREKGNRLKKIKEIFDKIFADLGCTIADAADRIAQWLFDLLFGFLSDVFYQASCFVDTLVEGIINQILSVLESLISTVLGPIQQLLSVLANPLNIIGGAINRVLSLLGISCSGPGDKCEKIQEVSVTCEEDDTDDKDFLDKLIKDIEDGPLNTTSGVCNEAKGLPPEEPTVVVFVGGVFTDPPATVASTPPGGPNTPASFFPEPFDPEDTIPGADIPSELPVPTPVIPDDPVDPPSPGETEEPYYEVSTDKNVYTEGEIITYTIKTLNVPNNTVLNYELSGPEIVEENIVDGLTGSFVVNNNTAPANSNPIEGNIVTITTTHNGLPIRGFLYYPTSGISGTQFDVVVLYHSTIESFGVTPFTAAQNFLNITLNNINIKDKIIFSVAYPQDAIPAWEANPSLPGTQFPGIDYPNFYFGDNITYAEAALLWVKSGGLNTYFTSNNIPRSINKIFTFGHSQGAYLTHRLNTMHAVDGVISNAPGPIDLLTVCTFLESNNDNNFTCAKIKTGIGSVTTNPSAYDNISLKNFLSGTLSPTLFTQALDDTTGNSFGAPQVANMQNIVQAELNTCTDCENITFNYYQTGGHAAFVSNTILQNDIRTFVNSNDLIKVATVQVTIADEGVVEDVPKLLNFSIVNTVAQASVVIDSNYVLVPGIDDDITLEPAYAVTSDKLTYSEGEDIIYTVITENVDDSTMLSYTLFGNNITSNDILGGNLEGTFIINNNTARIVIRLSETLEKENNEILTFVINGTGVSTDVTILKSLQPRKEREEDIPEPKINKPVADTPITDENGSIISIPVISSGDSYQKEPNVIIGGNGYGATAIALLDDNGFVSEIRVTRSGVNYKRNTTKDIGLSCVVDSYTLITPGVGYTSPPEVYVNGDNTIAEALINEDGFVYGVRVLDRSKTYDRLPKVEIIGGGGAGARVIANITCLDIEELERRGYAKVGTGKYIDCP
jgi:hypothetical protein